MYSCRRLIDGSSTPTHAGSGSLPRPWTPLATARARLDCPPTLHPDQHLPDLQLQLDLLNVPRFRHPQNLLVKFSIVHRTILSRRAQAWQDGSRHSFDNCLPLAVVPGCQGGRAAEALTTRHHRLTTSID